LNDFCVLHCSSYEISRWWSLELTRPRRTHLLGVRY
jgi:hypothetical protein